MHPFAIEVDDLVGGQRPGRSGRHQEEPRLLKRAVVEDDHIDRFLRGVLIGDVRIADGAPGPTAQATEAAPLAADADDRVAEAADHEGNVQAAQLFEERRAGAAAIHDEHRFAAGRQARGDQQQ